MQNTEIETSQQLSRLPDCCFVIAAASVVSGMCLGMYMGIVQDFTLAPVHAHTNLLGWASLALMGLYYRAHPKMIGRAAYMQAWMFVAGYLMMVIGMTGMFLGNEAAFLPLAIVGGVMLVVSAALFLWICWRNLRAGSNLPLVRQAPPRVEAGEWTPRQS
jgi:hypothetical protein